MKATFQRELYCYFNTSIAYIYLAVFYFFSGFYFAGYCLMQNSSELSEVFSSMFTICVFIIPLLTMRLMSEDRKNKTDQLFLTAPVSLLSIIMGKFLAAFVLLLIGTVSMLLYGVLFSFLGVNSWSLILGHIAGILLLGAALIAMGMFISSVTENQIIAAVGSVAAGLLLIMADSAAAMLQSGFLKKTLKVISFNTHYTRFIQGILYVPDIVFFLSIMAVFIMLTVRGFEQRRWR